MSKATREVVIQLMFIENMLRDVIENKVDGEAVASLNLALEFIHKALGVWGQKMADENKKSET